MKKLIMSLCTITIMCSMMINTASADHTRQFFTNENVGRIIGTGLGAVLGSQVGKGRGNDIAIAAGSVGGYVLGGKVGRDWRSKHQTHNQHYSGGSSRTGYLQPVTAMPQLDQINSTYRATQISNVRGGPSTQYVVVDGLRAGEEVRVLGRVLDKNWYLIAQDDIIQGFVHSSLLRPVEQYVSYN